jgi:hypothetical protein
MKKSKIMLFGSCRVYRPFLSNKGGLKVSNVFIHYEIIYLKYRLFHLLAEIQQVISFMINGIPANAKEYPKYLFRMKPEYATPDNIFSQEIINNYVAPVSLDDAADFLI